MDTPKSFVGAATLRRVAAGAAWSLYGAALLAASTAMLLLYARVGMLYSNSPQTMTMLAGGEKPFVYRVLTPLAANWIARRLPVSLVDTLASHPLTRQAVLDLAGWLPPASGAAMLIVLYVSLLLSLGSLAAILARFDFPRRRRLAAPFVEMALIVFIFPMYAIVYDLPTLAAWSLCLAALAYRRQALYLALFAIANLVKETALVLIPVWVAIHWQDRRQAAFWRALAGQAAVAGGIRAALLAVFWGHPGAVMQFHLPDQLAAVVRMPVFFLMGAVFFFVSAALVFRDWSAKPQFLRRAFSVSAPVMAGLYLIGGTPGEIRVFLELLPILLPLAWFARKPYRD